MRERIIDRKPARFDQRDIRQDVSSQDRYYYREVIVIMQVSEYVVERRVTCKHCQRTKQYKERRFYKHRIECFALAPIPSNPLDTSNALRMIRNRPSPRRYANSTKSPLKENSAVFSSKGTNRAAIITVEKYTGAAYLKYEA